MFAKCYLPFLCCFYFVFVLSAISCNRSVQPSPKATDLDKSPHSKQESTSLDVQIDELHASSTDSIQVMKQISDDSILKVPVDSKLRELLIEGGKLSKTGLDHISKIESLEHLRIRLTPIDDDSFLKLIRLPGLQIMNLPHANLSRASASKISNLESVAKLNLFRVGAPDWTDNEAKRIIEKIPTIRFLHLINVPVTDDFVSTLIEAKNLESIYLDGSKITDDGYSRLIKNRPDLHLHIDQKHLDFDPQKDHDN